MASCPRPSLSFYRAIQTPEDYVIKAELPGVKKEDVKLTYQDGVLHITAERKEEEMKEGERRHYSDFSYGSISRSVRVPEAADKEHIDASMADGVLTIKIKKGERMKEQAITIK